MSAISATAAISPAQVRAIHAALAHHGIDDPTYREMLAAYGASSCKELSRRQASDLLYRIGRPLRRPPGTRPPAAERLPDGIVRLASPAQRHLIEALATEVRWRTADGYRRWLRANQGLERVATAAQAASVIEGLKALKRRGGDGD